MPQDKPQIALNLDTLDREGGPTEPFVVVHDGKPMTFRDPGDIDWQDLLSALRNPQMFFRHALSDDDAKRFLDAKLPTWKLRKLMDAYQQHYNIPNPGEALASPLS